MSKKLTDKQYEELGKKLVAFYETGYVNKKQAVTSSFLKGLAGGFGAFLGGTILIGLLLWFLSLFDHIPLIDGLRDALIK
jgi:hypothetical protein